MLGLNVLIRQVPTHSLNYQQTYSEEPQESVFAYAMRALHFVNDTCDSVVAGNQPLKSIP